MRLFYRQKDERERSGIFQYCRVYRAYYKANRISLIQSGQIILPWLQVWLLVRYCYGYWCRSIINCFPFSFNLYFWVGLFGLSGWVSSIIPTSRVFWMYFFLKYWVLLISSIFISCPLVISPFKMLIRCSTWSLTWSVACGYLLSGMIHIILFSKDYKEEPQELKNSLNVSMEIFLSIILPVLSIKKFVR